jgi:predicted GIY-YIG superfamily endonuclease
MPLEGTKSLKEVVKSVFLTVSGGRSTDDLVIDDELNKLFTDACRQLAPAASPFDCNWTLFKLRKASGLGPVVTLRRKEQHGDYIHAAEIAARRMEDEYRLTIDRVFCHPEYRLQFDCIAAAIAPGISPYSLRKAAFRLRKGRRLKPELIKRVAYWDRIVFSYPAEQLIEKPDLLPGRPGVYIFSDRSGYLYIGEADNLRVRVSKHLDHSDRRALAHYFWEMGIKNLIAELHAFDAASDGRIKSCRRAYEADLIQNRRPRFNIQGSPSLG